MPWAKIPNASTPVMIACRRLANFIGHEVQQFQFRQFAFGIGARFSRSLQCLPNIANWSKFEFGAFAIDQIAHHAVDDQVGVAPNGRSKMAIGLTVQGVMSNFFRAVDRLLHAPQNGVVNGMLFGHFFRCFNDPFHFKTVLKVVAFDSEAADEIGQIRQFGFGRLRMDSSHQEKFLIDHSLGNRFVGRQHEFFDDLMAFGVLDRVGTADFAIVVQIDLDFRQHQS